MIDKQSASDHPGYVYAARLADGDLYFGISRSVEDIHKGLAKGFGNSRIRERLPLTLICSWQVMSMANAKSTMTFLRNLPPATVSAALTDGIADITRWLTQQLGPGRVILCTQCHELKARSRCGQNSICSRCFQKETSARCTRCRQPKHHVSPASGLCPKCAEIEARPVQPCARCKKVKPIIDTAQSLCRECRKYLRLIAKGPSKRRKVSCSVCGKLRAAGRKTQDICLGCAHREHAINGTCAGCGKRKRFKNKLRALCACCAMDRSAPGMVRKFLREFRSPFPGSREAFGILAETVDPDKADLRNAQRIINFGRYLQTHELAEPLTWGVLCEAASAVSSRKTAAKDIRGCLLTVGHRLANAGRIESRKDYLAQRKLSVRITIAPAILLPILPSFAEWSLRRKTTCQQVLAQVNSICALCDWCLNIGITSLESINQNCVEQYFLTTHWNLQCKCGSTLPIEFEGGVPACSCSCGSWGPFEKVAKRKPDTIRGARGRLVVFFDWAVLNGLISDNPVRIQVANPKQQIQHFPLEVLVPLLKYIQSPDSDPDEALALYLTIFHLFAVWELQHLRYPKTSEKPGEADLSELYGLTAPTRPVSLGRHSAGREILDFSFPESARPWLPQLLARFQDQRSRILQGKKNDFLFVAPGKCQNAVPVSSPYISKLVQRAAKRALGYGIPQKLLRKTAALLVAAEGGAESLRYLGFEEQQATAYVEARREVVNAPQTRSPAGNAQNKRDNNAHRPPQVLGVTPRRHSTAVKKEAKQQLIA